MYMYSGRREVSLVKGHEIAKPVITFSVGTMIDGWFFGSYEEVRATDLYLQIDGLAEGTGGRVPVSRIIGVSNNQ